MIKLLILLAGIVHADTVPIPVSMGSGVLNDKIMDSVTVTPGTGTWQTSGTFNQGVYTITMGSGSLNVSFTSGSYSNPFYTLSTGTQFTQNVSSVAVSGNVFIQSISSIALSGTSFTQNISSIALSGTSFTQNVSSISISGAAYILTTGTIFTQNISSITLSGTVFAQSISSIAVSGQVLFGSTGTVFTQNVSSIAISAGVYGSSISIANVFGSSLATVISITDGSGGNHALGFAVGGSSLPAVILGTAAVSMATIPPLVTGTANIGTVNGTTVAVVVPAGTNGLPIVIATSTVLASTSGVIGSVSLGNANGKTNVFMSSSVVSSSIKWINFSSKTVSIGKTFYLQHFDFQAFVNAPSTVTYQSVVIGSLGLFSNGVYIASQTFYMNGLTPFPYLYALDFDEPVPIPTVFLSSFSVGASSGTTFNSNMIGYEK